MDLPWEQQELDCYFYMVTFCSWYEGYLDELFGVGRSLKYLETSATCPSLEGSTVPRQLAMQDIAVAVQ